MARTDRPTASEQSFLTRAQQLEQRPPCQVGCPNSGDVRGWLGIIAQRRKHGLSLEQAYSAAWNQLVELNPFPATIGRICPHPCESRCTRASKDGAVAINDLERFLGDWAIAHELALPHSRDRRCVESIGVIGSGPAGLSFAYQMARRGYRVSVYEKNATPGGMLRHAIPEYRLPRSVVEAEIQRVFDLGVSLQDGVNLSEDMQDLRERHSLLFLGLGAQRPRRLDIPGDSLVGVVSGIDYLARRKQGKSTKLGASVLVIGGGNTAIDAARTARRDGAAVTLLYRRSRQEMPAAAAEVDDAIDEGVRFLFLVAPTEVLGDGKKVTGLDYQHMRLGAPDEQGRRRPTPVKGETGRLAADSIIVAISQQPDWHDDGWLKTREDGRLANDLWAGGDDTGPGIASRAVAQGRLAAQSAHAQLRGETPLGAPSVAVDVDTGKVRTDFYDERRRHARSRLPPKERLERPEDEVDRTIDSRQASEEASRCMSCGLCFDCQQCVMYCNAGGFSRLENTTTGHYFELALDVCEGCGKCVELCPCGYLTARQSRD